MYLFFFYVVIVVLQDTFAYLYCPGTSEFNVSYHQNYHLLDYSSICGRVNHSNHASSRIANAVPTFLGEHPWMAIVSVNKVNSATGEPVHDECAGTLITDRYVLTAARCFHFTGVDQKVKVYLRVYQQDRLDIINCDDKRCSLPPEELEAEEVIIHPEYYHEKSHNNVALIRLNKKVVFDEFMKPVCLPLNCNIRTLGFEGNFVTMVGWDHVGAERAGLAQDAVEQSTMLVVPRHHCQDRWGGEKLIPDNEMCAIAGVPPTWKVGACAHDIGGPLMTLHQENKQFIQIGIISQSVCENNFAKLGLPTICSRVGAYVPFILENIKP